MVVPSIRRSAARLWTVRPTRLSSPAVLPVTPSLALRWHSRALQINTTLLQLKIFGLTVRKNSNAP